MTKKLCPCCGKMKDAKKDFEKEFYCCDNCEEEKKTDDQGREDYYWENYY